MDKYNVTEEEINLLLDKFDEVLYNEFGETHYDKIVEGFLDYLETYNPHGYTAPTREYQLEYAFASWLQEL